MRVLVTGAGGFIGGHVYRLLREHGHAVSSFVGDVANIEDWDPQTGDYDAVCHLAALVGTADSMERPRDYVWSNVLGTATMLRALRGRMGRVILASSAAVYGSRRHAIVESPLNPQSVYAVTKRMQEELLGFDGVPAVILRPFSVYGPGQTNPDGGLVGILARQILAGEPPRVTEDGEQLRDFVHVSDVAEAFRVSLKASPGVYNLGTGVETAVGALAFCLSGLVKGETPAITGETRPGDVRHLTAHPFSGLRGWEPKVPLDEGLLSYCEGLR